VSAWSGDRSRRSRGEAGFTLVEVLIAVFILTLASLAALGILTSAVRNGQRAKATQVALNAAQQQLEKLHSLSYEELAMTAPPPAHSSNPLSPDNRVVNGTFALQHEPISEYSTMVVNGGPLYGGVEKESTKTITGGVVTPGPIAFESGDVTGQLYRYVVWRDDPTCQESTVSTEDYCPGNQDYKQIVVAVKLDKGVAQQAERGYVEVQSEAIDAKTVNEYAKANENGGSGGTAHTGTSVTAQQFFLTDTPCATSGSTERAEIEGDHLLHNTLSICASGLQTGSTPGAPDALVLGGPPDPAPEDPTNPALYDYASDVEPIQPMPETDKGAQIRLDSTSGCHFNPTGTAPASQAHRWVSDQLAEEFEMNGKVTIEFYTRSLYESAASHGTLCVYLFKRHETTSGGKTTWTDSTLKDKATENLYWTYTPQGNGYWPRGEWTKVRLTMEFKTPSAIDKNDRLGVALTVDPGNTDAAVEAIPIMYDNPKYPTRIEVDTTTPIEGT
jgi:prepilin-type N-terminal cleavage/methylation domain-containing protein